VKDRTNTRLLTAAVLAAPVAAMALVRLLFGDPVAPAIANVRAHDPRQSDLQLAAATELSATDRLTAEQLKLLASGAMWAQLDSDTPSPMLEQQAVAAAPEQVKQEDPDPIIEISSVMGAGERTFATINGRVCRTGDTVAPGWTLIRIDAPARRVWIRRDTDGRELELTIGR